MYEQRKATLWQIEETADAQATAAQKALESLLSFHNQTIHKGNAAAAALTSATSSVETQKNALGQYDTAKASITTKAAENLQEINKLDAALKNLPPANGRQPRDDTERDKINALNVASITANQKHTDLTGLIALLDTAHIEFVKKSLSDAITALQTIPADDSLNKNTSEIIASMKIAGLSQVEHFKNSDAAIKSSLAAKSSISEKIKLYENEIQKATAVLNLLLSLKNNDQVKDQIAALEGAITGTRQKKDKLPALVADLQTAENKLIIAGAGYAIDKLKEHLKSFEGAEELTRLAKIELDKASANLSAFKIYDTNASTQCKTTHVIIDDLQNRHQQIMAKAQSALNALQSIEQSAIVKQLTTNLSTALQNAQKIGDDCNRLENDLEASESPFTEVVEKFEVKANKKMEKLDAILVGFNVQNNSLTKGQSGRSE